MENGFITTTTVFKGSPAALAGIQRGDIIVSVNGVSTAGLNLDQVVAKIQGKSGTRVTLGMHRPSASLATTTTTTTESGSAAASPTITARAALSIACRRNNPGLFACSAHDCHSRSGYRDTHRRRQKGGGYQPCRLL